MRSVKSVLVAGAVALFSTTAFAADAAIDAPPPPPYGYAPPTGYAPPPGYALPPGYARPFAQPLGGEFSGWYLRGDIGFSHQRFKSTFNVLYEAPGIGVQSFGGGFDASSTFSVGGGFQFNDWFRFDLTGEFQGKSSLHGLDVVSFNRVPIGTDDYRGTKHSWLVLLNLYAELGTWWGFTPFIGGGVGGNSISISSFVDSNVPNGGTAFASDSNKFNLAWAVHAGLSHKINQNLTVELAYRFLNQGDARSGDLQTFSGVNLVNNPMYFNGITSHDIRFGLRWYLCDPILPVAPVAPVLMRRG